ncbi:MAG: hypothetical protein ROO73_00670 [Roseivirga sp.]
MRINLRRLLFQLLGLDLLAQELTKLLMKQLDNLKAEIKQKLFTWILRLLLLMGLAHAVLLFILSALALYLNVLLESNYQGFLWVAGGCAASLLLLLLRHARWLPK